MLLYQSLSLMFPLITTAGTARWLPLHIQGPQWSLTAFR